ncbi:MAG: hypothetical protein LBP68_01285 [Acidobacteriota bacterium]|jgi:enamine deaminase RidA (YjgF/YER057c/UK114 family)|nr:hypothetical protein [Acidobacteriota bacterium]
MEYLHRKTDKANLEISSFAAGDANEIHLFVKNDRAGGFEEQLSSVTAALGGYLKGNDIPSDAVAFARYFVSDYSNQAGALQSVRGSGAVTSGAVSIVQQPPLDDSKLAAWFYIVADRTGKTPDMTVTSDAENRMRRGHYEHLWNTGLSAGQSSSDSFRQTADIFSDYGRKLERYGYCLKDDLIRTWLFVKDIDSDYGGVVEARKDFFHRHGLTADTHYVASTGIGGRHADPAKSVLMDAYAVRGLSRKQVRFLQARENLNPTYEYGVTFERGTSIDYGDRRHIFISGTASIDRDGNILHVNDVRRQTERAVENIEALLDDAGATLGDVAQMLVYLRDVADARTVAEALDARCRNIPKVVLLAPVCRPGWLVEIECIAVRPATNLDFANF